MISAKDIHEIEKKRNNIKKEIYKRIYEQFCKKIKMAVELGVKSVDLSIPKFIMGYPIFDRYKASVYLQRQLSNAGFIVHLRSQLEFAVTWDSQTHSGASSDHTHHTTEDFPSLINLKKLVSKHKGA